MFKNFLIAVCMVALMAAPALATNYGCLTCPPVDSSSNFQGDYGSSTNAFEFDGSTVWATPYDGVTKVIKAGAQASGFGEVSGSFSGTQGIGAGISGAIVIVTAKNTFNEAHASGIVANGAIGFVTPGVTEVCSMERVGILGLFGIKSPVWSLEFNQQELSGSGELETVAIKGNGIAQTYGSFSYGAQNLGGIIAGGGVTGGMSNVKSSNGGHTTTATAVSGTAAGAVSITFGPK